MGLTVLFSTVGKDPGSRPGASGGGGGGGVR